MSIVFAGKVFSRVINDLTNTYYSDDELDEALGLAEKFFIEVKGSNVNGTPTLTLTLETSEDGVNWTTRSTPISATYATNPRFASELGTGQTGGRFARFGAKHTGSGGGYLEVWVTGRDAL
jgi:hypothetical protein